jgi:hypothetical protein
LAATCERFGVASEVVLDPVEAIARSREIANRNGGVAVVTGSHYLLSTYGQGSEK